MKDILHYLITHIVSNPSDVSIEEKRAEHGIVLVVNVHPEDMGQVIGKRGRIIGAIRDVTKMVATKHGEYVDVELAETEKVASAM